MTIKQVFLRGPDGRSKGCITLDGTTATKYRQFDVTELDPSERQLLFGIVDLMKAYEKAHPEESK